MIIDQIESIVSGLTDPPYFAYGRKSDINIQADDFEFPAICLIESDQFGFKVDPVNGNVFDTNNLFIQFIDKCVMGEQADDRVTKVEAMKTLCAGFLMALSESDYFQDMNLNVPAVLVVDAYDANVCGLEINLAQLTDIIPRPC